MSAPPPVTPDPLGSPPKAVSAARLALGRAGAGMPTHAVLAFAEDHARARDAVHAGLDRTALGAASAPLGLEILTVDSAAPDRSVYLRRPDFGRRLSRESRTVLAARPRADCDVVLVIADGLSASATATHAPGLAEALATRLKQAGLRLGPVVLAGQARVALGDEVGALLAARLAIVLIGERPGLSAADSLGAYLTLEPRIGRTDAERNCVSNIRPGGLSVEQAADKLAWLTREAFRLNLTGVALKDASDEPAALPASAPKLAGPDRDALTAP